MKNITCLILLMVLYKLTFSNAIDSLKSNDDVNRFLVEKVQKNWKGTSFLNRAKSNTTQYGKDQFLKLDLNDDGLTDLIINCSLLFAVVDEGNSIYSIHSLDRGPFLNYKSELSNIIYHDKTPFLVIKFSEYISRGGAPIPKFDTLIFKFGNFVEYNKKPSKLKIQKISYSTSGCYGTCPIFDMVIDTKHSAIFNARDYNDISGRFISTLDGDTYDQIVATINYIRLTSLNDDYSVNWTDDQTSNLEITYNDGQVKKIKDYGMIGTFGLANLYAQLSALRGKFNWHKFPDDIMKH